MTEIADSEVISTRNHETNDFVLRTKKGRREWMESDSAVSTEDWR